MCVCWRGYVHMNAGTHRDQRRQILLELELWMVAYQIGSEYQAQVFCKNSRHSKLLRHPPRPRDRPYVLKHWANSPVSLKSQTMRPN